MDKNRGLRIVRICEIVRILVADDENYLIENVTTATACQTKPTQLRCNVTSKT